MHCQSRWAVEEIKKSDPAHLEIVVKGGVVGCRDQDSISRVCHTVQQQVDDTATTRQGCQVLWVNINALQQTIRKYVAANSH